MKFGFSNWNINYESEKICIHIWSAEQNLCIMKDIHSVFFTDRLFVVHSLKVPLLCVLLFKLWYWLQIIAGGGQTVKLILQVWANQSVCIVAQIPPRGGTSNQRWDLQNSKMDVTPLIRGRPLTDCLLYTL